MVTETEADFASWVKDLAQFYGWLAYHTWRSIHSPAGYPDLTLCRPPRVIMAELKKQDGKVSLAQQEWLDALAQCPGVECYLWRPSNREKIQEVLAP